MAICVVIVTALLTSCMVQSPSHRGLSFPAVGMGSQTESPLWKLVVLDWWSYESFWAWAASIWLVSMNPCNCASLVRSCCWYDEKYHKLDYHQSRVFLVVCQTLTKWWSSYQTMNCCSIRKRTNGKCCSQSASFSTYDLSNCRRDLLKRSTMPSPCGWYAVVCDLTIPKACKVCFKIVLSKFCPLDFGHS